MPTEPDPVTVASVVARAAETADPAAEDDAVNRLLMRFEDRDEPIAALEDPAETFRRERMAIDPEGADGALLLTQAIATYLAFRRDEADAGREDLIRLALQSEFAGMPPEPVSDALAVQGVRLD